MLYSSLKYDETRTEALWRLISHFYTWKLLNAGQFDRTHFTQARFWFILLLSTHHVIKCTWALSTDFVRFLITHVPVSSRLSVAVPAVDHDGPSGGRVGHLHSSDEGQQSCGVVRDAMIGPAGEMELLHLSHLIKTPLWNEGKNTHKTVKKLYSNISSQFMVIQQFHWPQTVSGHFSHTNDNISRQV